MKYPADKIYAICQEIFTKHKYSYKKVDMLYISQIYISEYLLGLYDEKNIIKKLKKYSLDDLAKYLFYKKSTFLTSKINQSKQKDILFFFEIKNSSMIENLYSLYCDMKSKHINVRIIGNNHKILSEDIHNIFKYSNLIKSIYNIFRIRKDLKDLSKVITNDLKKTININGSFQRNLYHHLVSNVFVIDTLDNYIKYEQSNKIVLVTDVHKWSRTLVLLAKKYHKSTYVLQHGATVLEYGYLPVTTENLITWGELSKKWFTERGTNLQKIRALGSPKFDILFNKLNISTIENKHILVVLNPIGKEKIKEMFLIILPALEKLKIKTIIKLHPSSDDYYDLVTTMFTKDFFEIQKKSDTTQLILDSITVITTTSSVGIETILLNKPLCQVKLKNIPLMDYESYSCQHNINSSDDLIYLIKNKDKLYKNIKNYKNFIFEYCNEFNGNSKKKIGDFILHD